MIQFDGEKGVKPINVYVKSEHSLTTHIWIPIHFNSACWNFISDIIIVHSKVNSKKETNAFDLYVYFVIFYLYIDLCMYIQLRFIYYTIRLRR